METEGLSFPDAVERLAGMAGVPMPRLTGAEVEQEKKRASLLDVLAMAARLFEANLQRAGRREGARLSLRPRARAAVQQRFSLGYSAPDRFALRDALAAKGVGADQMIEAGLLIHGEGIAVPYDRFRDRVMFPIHDRAGRVDRLRRPGDGAGRQGEIPQFAGDAALPQGLAAVQPSPGPQARARFRRARRGRGLYRRDRDERGGLSQRRRAARHRADRRPVRASVGDGGRADPVLRRRQRRPQGGVPRHRDRAAADRRGQEPALRPASRGPGPGRSDPRERRAGDGRGAERRPAVRRHAVPARVRGPAARHAGEPRGARAPARRGGRARSPTRRCAGTTRPT